ncbi:trans-aconitate 2-methyltransferase [Catellatospora sichuanensis]|uniref:trans-aconitate 2-methyltransferase n=1 Tax=Catellatospora sichuanensis TaxID=1969805 RepID=UPI0011841962|nr:trans-aconitate 2-methyltransferase [Catellatospora sichuanensis]
MWNPETYLRFADERGRPFHDLLARVDAEQPRQVVDLGCGPGNLTATLTARWPGAQVRGIDSSPEMIEKAVADQGGPGPVSYQVGDVREYLPGPEVDVIVTNAVLQWVPGQEELVGRWARALRPGAWLALQVPGNHDGPAHRALRELCASSRWSALLGEIAEQPRSVPGSQEYARLLRAAGCAADTWETEYVHQLPVTGGPHPVLTWLTGTALRPVRAALAEQPGAWEAFCVALEPALISAYPADGAIVDFPFRRVFAVGRRTAAPS